MPIPRKDRVSGAIIFDLTPEEQQVRDMTKELKDKVAMVDSLISQLQMIQQSSQSKEV